MFYLGGNPLWSPSTGSRLVLKGGRVLDVVEGIRDRADVVLEGDTVESIWPGDYAAHDGDVVMDISGKTLMPGMVSCHFHADYRGLSIGAGTTITPARDAETAFLTAAASGEALVASGFTGYVGAGCSFNVDSELQSAIAGDLVVGPRIKAGSGYISLSKGAEAARRAVEAHADRGSEIMKVFLTGGHGTPEEEAVRGYDPEALRAVIATSHERGCLVRAHVVYRAEIVAALEAGVDVIDHGDGSDLECFERMVARGVYWVPSALFNKAMMMNTDDSQVETSLRVAAHRDYASQAEMLPTAAAMGVKIVLGDDYGTELLPHVPGSYGREISLYAGELGCSPLDVLRWATVNGSELLGKGRHPGTVVPGATADLVILDGDPLTEVDIFERSGSSVAAVIRDGRCVYTGDRELGARSSMALT